MDQFFLSLTVMDANGDERVICTPRACVKAGLPWDTFVDMIKDGAKDIIRELEARNGIGDIMCQIPKEPRNEKPAAGS